LQEVEKQLKELNAEKQKHEKAIALAKSKISAKGKLTNGGKKQEKEEEEEETPKKATGKRKRT